MPPIPSIVKSRPSRIVSAFITLSTLAALFMLPGCAGPVGQANLALLRGDYQAAENILSQAVQDDSEDLAARRRLAMTYYYMGREEDPEKFSRAVEQFEFIKDRRSMQPEEQFYLGLSLIGQGKREDGFMVLKTLSHPTKFRLQQFVRQRASQLEASQELPPREIFSEMEKAWREGDEEDKREQIDERRDDPFTRNSPVPLR